MEAIKHFLNFLTDSSKRWSSRALVSLGILFLLWLLNDLTGFTYNYSIQNRLQTYKQVNELLKDTTISEHDRSILLDMRTQSISRETFYHRVLSFFGKRNQPYYYSDISYDIRNPILMFVSSSFFYLILVLLSFIALFADKSTPFLKSLATISVAIVIVISVSCVMTYFFWKIPLLGKNPWWNYGLNFLLHTIFVLLMTGAYAWMKRNTP